ncbi:NAD-dependent epimerase/dehydratase family protein [Neobacillus drentensis]|uniref:NAD-dependent epimerase/dehydratase family protein n=1 Tax=Neobacillus drentensis TaxID=220684 RepID=UPI00285FB6F1|nr:NAD(P)-dependent oxidoreductase [Neobacillus drentensis]MDR7238080.1 nucleoside-diphosphate-sugar epimerase [Neobacillus drentensis]
MNVLIIGGDGFVGSHITREFVEKGHNVTLFGLKLNENLIDDLQGNITFIEGNIMDYISLVNALGNNKTDIIIHLAAFGAGKDGLAKSAQENPKMALDVNILGFYNVLEAGKNAGVKRLLWSGSSTVYAPSNCYDEGLVNEQSARNPVTFYGSTKVMDELMTTFYRNQYGMEVCSLRLPLVYGPGRWYKGAGGAFVDMFENCHSRDEVVIKGGTELVDLMYVKDVSGLFYQLAVTKEKLSEIYNVKSHTTSVSEMVDFVKNCLPEYQLTLEITETGATVYPLMDTSKIEKEIGYFPKYTVIEACEDYLDALRRKVR